MWRRFNLRASKIVRSTCKECGGGSICEHQRLRSRCKECEGGSICEHQRLRSLCKTCSPHNVIINLIRSQVRRCFNTSTLNKINHSIEYLGCDVETLKSIFKTKWRTKWRLITFITTILNLFLALTLMMKRSF
jgi:hypothetical protein